MKTRSWIAAAALFAVQPRRFRRAHQEPVRVPRPQRGRRPHARRLPADPRLLQGARRRVAARRARRSWARRRSARTCSWRSISSEANIANLPRLKEIARRLADPRGLSDAEADALVARGQGGRCSSPATSTRPRSAPRQMAMEWAHALATARGRGDEAAARRRGPAAGAVAQPRRPDHGDRVVPQEPRHPLRGRPACRGSTTTTSATTTTATGSC